MNLRIKYLVLILILFPLIINAKTLYISVLDRNNPISFMDYFGEAKKFKNKDRMIILDAESTQIIYDASMNYEDIVEYSDKRAFVRHFNKVLEVYDRKFLSKLELFRDKKIFSSEVNDFSRQLNVVHELLRVYSSKYKKIKVMFFGNSYMHNAYGHDFSKGIPSDGFIYLEESEFNTFDDMDVSEAKFAIFYDDEPETDREQTFRFYRKLLKKKFNTLLQSFNDNATFDSDENIRISTTPFMKDIIKVVKNKNIDECSELDKPHKNYVEETATIEIEVVNLCRKDSILTFYHNGKPIQVDVDKNGRAQYIFKAVVGINKITYNNLKGDKKIIFDEKISSSNIDIQFEPDFATGTVLVKGNNPLRVEGTQFELLNDNTGNIYYLTVHNGNFSKSIPIEIGKNRFTWKDIDGEEHEKIIVFEPKCTDKVTTDKNYAEEYGILNVTLYNKCREDGSLVTLFYKTKKYYGMIRDGEANIEIILKSDINDIFYEDFDRNKQKLETIKIRDFNDLIRFIISYKDNVVIAMNIFEPNINVDTTKSIVGVSYEKPSEFKEGHIHIKNPTSKVGQILIGEIPASKDYLSQKYIKNYKQVYVTRKSKLKSGNIALYVDYFSRHGRYEGQEALCGKRSLGGVVVDYEILDEGTLEASKKFLNPARCIKNVEDGSLNPQNEDNELIFIKKVEIK